MSAKSDVYCGAGGVTSLLNLIELLLFNVGTHRFTGWTVIARNGRTTSLYRACRTAVARRLTTFRCAPPTTNTNRSTSLNVHRRAANRVKKVRRACVCVGTVYLMVVHCRHGSAAQQLLCQ